MNNINSTYDLGTYNLGGLRPGAYPAGNIREALVHGLSNAWQLYVELIENSNGLMLE